MRDYTVGVEEEFHVVDGATDELRTDGPDLVGAARGRLPGTVEPELLRTQIEVATPICATLAEVRTHLTQLRHELALTAAEVGCRIAASGS